MNAQPHSVVVAGRITAAGNPGKCNHLIYAMTCDDYDALEARSGGKCEICRADLPRPHLDHDHAAGWFAVRGMVCPKCNAHLRRVDAGERVAEGATAAYLANPFWVGRDLKPRRAPAAFLSSRIPTKLKKQAAAKAAAEGRDLTDVIRRSLERYVKTK